MQVIVDPAKLAARQVTMTELAAALDRENRNYSGGYFDEGKRRYIVRTVGEYQSPEDVENIVVAVRDGVPDLPAGRRPRPSWASARTGPASSRRASRSSPSTSSRRPAPTSSRSWRASRPPRGLNQEQLARRGLELVQAYDETEYVSSSIDLVRQSLMVGGMLAVIMLLLFLRSATSTLVIAIAIPISIVGTFLLMACLGRTLNVVSLAGLAFAVGMVVDNSIVVLENIYRHRQMGKPRSPPPTTAPPRCGGRSWPAP